MTSTSPAAASQPYIIRCAEIWGGTSVKEDQLATPGLHAAIHSSASGDSKGGDLYYVSVCAYDTLTRIAVADVRGHGESVNHLSEWLYQVLDERMNYPSSAAVLADLNDIVHSRGFEAITTAVVATFHRDNSMKSAPWLRQRVKTLFTIRCEFIVRQPDSVTESGACWTSASRLPRRRSADNWRRCPVSFTWFV